jgi:hypothetical protein
MEIQKNFQKKIELDYFFIEGTLPIDSNYFINCIDRGVTEEGNMNGKTNIKSKMTSFRYFNNDLNFLNLCNSFIDVIDDNIKMDAYELRDAWGFRCDNGSRTLFHSHNNYAWSGVVYLNEHPQTLDFPDIKQKVKPVAGKFALFSSFLKHGCKRHSEDYPKYGLSFNWDNILAW